MFLKIKNITGLLVVISMITSFLSFSQGTIDQDTIRKDSIKEIIYSGLAKNVVDYLESQNSAQNLAEYLTRDLGIEIDQNQAQLLNKVASYYGLTDVVGDSNNTQVLQFFIESDHSEILDDDMSWCSVYMSSCAKSVNLERSTSLLARSWLEVGEVIESPQTGDLVIFWREKQKSWQGHVSIFLSEDPVTHQIYCIGGNQDDKVCVKPYPVEQVLGYRRLNVVQQ